MEGITSRTRRALSFLIFGAASLVWLQSAVMASGRVEVVIGPDDVTPGRIQCYLDGKEGTVPFPFEALNRHVELADDEVYLLQGIIYKSDGQFYLNIDFDLHPWLANPGRRENPFYAIRVPPYVTNGSRTKWSLEQYREQSVRVLVRAKGVVRLNSGGGQYATYHIALDVLEKPLKNSPVQK
jgi:hypothetical protein